MRQVLHRRRGGQLPAHAATDPCCVAFTSFTAPSPRSPLSPHRPFITPPGPPRLQVWVSSEEVDRIAAHLGLSRARFQGQHTKSYSRASGWRMLKYKDGSDVSGAARLRCGREERCLRSCVGGGGEGGGGEARGGGRATTGAAGAAAGARLAPAAACPGARRRLLRAPDPQLGAAVGCRAAAGPGAARARPGPSAQLPAHLSGPATTRRTASSWTPAASAASTQCGPCSAARTLGGPGWRARRAGGGRRVRRAAAGLLLRVAG
jgi:hypothetical protein